MRFAFFTSIVPDGNPTTGFEIANDAILTGLRELGHSVTVFGFRLPRQGSNDLDDQVVLGVRELENATAGAGAKLGWLAQAVRRGLPYAAAKLADFSPDALDRLIAEHGPFDAYILNSYQMPAAFPHLRNHPHIYVAHNVEHRSASQNAEAAGSRLQRFLYRRDARLLRPLEAKLCDGANFVWTFSQDDVEDHGLSAGEGGFLPLFIPHQGAAKAEAPKQYDAGLIGTWSWQPNFVGLQWFLEQVVPLLPDTMKIAVAGVVPEGGLKPDPKVDLLGRVESADAFLNSVRVVPLISRGGTGVQLKTIEALQAGRACVATSSSLRGMDGLPANCRQADSAEDFAAALKSLVEQQKSGQIPEADGQSFLRKQRQSMNAGLALGVAAVA